MQASSDFGGELPDCHAIARAVEELTQDDLALIAAYGQWPDKGPLVDGRRLTIMTGTERCAVGEAVRVVHVLEVTAPGEDLYVMGPKAVAGEYVDGLLQGEDRVGNENPFVPLEYDGRVAKSPGVDANFEVTVYRFSSPGVHQICWQPGQWCSNTLGVLVEP